MTRVEDAWSQSVQQAVRLSVYPLALWIASSWWRLRWEPPPYKSLPDVSWRMAHEMAAAGYGFLWPRLTFESDGERVEAICRPSNPLSAEPVRYLSDFREAIDASSFERTIDEFMSLVLARLDAVGVSGMDLRQLWGEVLEERGDRQITIQRKIEAQLGFEPDEAPEILLQKLIELSEGAGAGAVAEIAPACAGPQPNRTLQEILDFSESPGTNGQLVVPKDLFADSNARQNRSTAPGDRGWLLAKEARAAWGFGSHPLSDEMITDLLNVSVDTLRSNSSARRPLGLAIRSQDTNDLRLLFHKRNRLGLRFEAARFIADHILNPVRERWLPATDTGTARQKVQRAFAAEFLSPIHALKDFLGDDFSPGRIEEAGDYFGVSELAVKSHLANHGLIPFDAVTV